jgi:hypothetical protein
MKLKGVVAFSGLQLGVPTSLPHGLTFSDQNVTPDMVHPDVSGFAVTADDTNVTVTRLGSTDSVNVLAERWKTDERSFGGDFNSPFAALSPQPFIPAMAGLDALTGSPTFVYDPKGDAPAAPNVFTDWDNLMAAKSNVVGQKIIFFYANPGAVSGLSIPANGTPYDMQDTTWLFGSSFPWAQVENGATFTDLGNFVGLGFIAFVDNLNETDPMITYSGDFGSVTMQNVLIEQLAAVPANQTPAFEWDLATGSFADFRMSGGGIFERDNQTPAISIGANNTVRLISSYGGFTRRNMLVGGVDATCLVINGNPFQDRSPGQPRTVLRYQFDDQPAYTGLIVITVPAAGEVMYSMDAQADDTNTPFAALHGDIVRTDTTVAAVQIDLPKSAFHTGQEIYVKDVGGNALVNNITIVPAAGETIGGAANLVINVNDAFEHIVADGISDWVVL